MLAGLPYKAWLDGLSEERREARRLTHQYNLLAPDQREEKDRLIRAILGSCGEYVNIEPPFRCDYGTNIQVGENFFANYNLTVLDVAKVVIGENVMMGPNVSIYTAGHPVHPATRNSLYEYGREVTIGDNCWIGGNTVICPGVRIGNNVVIGAGSVVTRDIPDWSIAAGNPCRVIRTITEADERLLFRKETIDDEAWEDIKKKQA